MSTLALPLIDIDPKFVLEVASGVIDPALLAENYGYSPETWQQLKEFEPFIKQVEAKKAELKANGYTFRMKSAIAAEDLLEDVYKEAKKEGASFHTKLESLKFFAKAGGIEAPVREQANDRPTFSISINLGDGKSVQIGVNNAVQTQQDDEFTLDASLFDPVVEVTTENEPVTSTLAFPRYTPTPLPA